MIRFKNPQKPLSLLGKGTQIACLFLPVRVNGDVALLKGIMKEMLETDRAAGGKLLAHDFIAHQTEGFDALVRDLDATTWDEIVKESGVSRELIAEGADDRARVRADDLRAGRWGSPSTTTASPTCRAS